ncbi:translation initiation factor IF-2-like [Aplysia californica]|uniref:Translation initiation factor IF-2-like n=1 Tax=Aplysia californica TaxID=6500 RepID=A0ABM1VQM0_APLCA|nr:translation initiation factor IF-2-like [Aplysia californica]
MQMLPDYCREVKSEERNTHDLRSQSIPGVRQMQTKFRPSARNPLLPPVATPHDKRGRHLPPSPRAPPYPQTISHHHWWVATSPGLSAAPDAPAEEGPLPEVPGPRLFPAPTVVAAVSPPAHGHREHTGDTLGHPGTPWDTLGHPGTPWDTRTAPTRGPGAAHRKATQKSASGLDIDASLGASAAVDKIVISIGKSGSSRVKTDRGLQFAPGAGSAPRCSAPTPARALGSVGRGRGPLAEVCGRRGPLAEVGVRCQRWGSVARGGGPLPEVPGPRLFPAPAVVAAGTPPAHGHREHTGDTLGHTHSAHRGPGGRPPRARGPPTETQPSLEFRQIYPEIGLPRDIEASPGTSAAVDKIVISIGKSGSSPQERGGDRGVHRGPLAEVCGRRGPLPEVGVRCQRWGSVARGAWA